MTKLSLMERAALDHSNAELAYRRSPQAKIDLEAGKVARAARDKALGHSPNCTLTRCADDCPRNR